MAFLDNSGDIILDAVLTDTGRFRMARGDFRISKFALGDDEIDYSLFNKNHPSGSAYYDLEVLRTPLLEAFTNNTSTMKSKLLSINASNVLHLPVLKLLNGGNTGGTGIAQARYKNSKTHSATGGFLITCDSDTELVGTGLVNNDLAQKGIILGSNTERVGGSVNFVALERGLDTTEISPQVRMPATLQETQFIIEADYRLGSLVDIGAAASPLPVSFIDDDQIASYYVSEGTNDSGQPVVAPPLDSLRSDRVELGEKSMHNIRGPRDRILQFKLQPSINLISSNFLFDKLGSTITTTSDNELNGFKAATYKIIDTLVRVTSATTAYSIDIPIRYIKKQ
tara:strand:- start:33598 stop:34614 length:1017 start_codon:yes stop_codon:yes gene_type:complete